MYHYLKHLSWSSIFAYLLGGALLCVVSYCIYSSYESMTIHKEATAPLIQKVLLPGEEICGSSEIECPELKKINDRLSFANNITAIGHTITRGSEGKNIATINFPAFSEHTPEEKKKIFQEIRTSNAKILALGIVSIDQGYETEIQDILSNISFDELRIQMYAEPENIIELFDIITWKQNKNMKLTLEFINLRFPADLKLFNYIYMSEKMILRNNGNIPLASFSLVFNPLFGEFNNIYRYILYPADGKVLKNFPTRELHITGMHTNYVNRADGMYEDQKGRTYDFLNTSQIQNIFIDSIGRKENGTITLYGF